MATRSINKTIVIESDNEAKDLINALEQSEELSKKDDISNKKDGDFYQ